MLLKGTVISEKTETSITFTRVDFTCLCQLPNLCLKFRDLRKKFEGGGKWLVLVLVFLIFCGQSNYEISSVSYECFCFAIL